MVREVEVEVVVSLWGLARSPPPPAPPLNGAVQLCTLQWGERRPKSGGPAAQKAAERRRRRRRNKLLLSLEKRQPRVPIPLQLAPPARPAGGGPNGGSKVEEEGRRRETRSLGIQR